MAFLPQTRKEKFRLFLVLLLLVYIGIEIRLGAKYAGKRDSEFRAFQWNSETLWRLRSNFDGDVFGKSINVNSEGFRGTREYSVKKNTDIRIITFGDSRTFGFKIEENETYSAVLERELKSRGIDAEVINAGTHGFSSVQCRLRLRQLLDYQPDIIVFAPGYNDKRYLISRPPDSEESFRSIARVRRVADVIQTSNVLFAFFYEVGMKKLKEMQQDAPPLDKVDLRVSEETFKNELEATVELCSANNIQPIFFTINHNPNAFGIVEAAWKLHLDGKTEEAIVALEEQRESIPIHALALYHYSIGKMFESLEMPLKAQEHFATHEPLGSLFGDAVLRSEETYFDLYRAVADERSIPLVNARDAIIASSPPGDQPDFGGFFVDECHYNAEAHKRMGTALSEVCMNIINKK